MHLKQNIGNLHKVKIAHDNSGLGPAWFLENVVVLREDESKQWFFPCNRWYLNTLINVKLNAHIGYPKM